MSNGANGAANGSYIDQGEFELIHQRVHVTVTPSDEARRVVAFAELHVVPLTIEAASLVVNARQINVTQVKVKFVNSADDDWREIPFDYVSFLENVAGHDCAFDLDSYATNYAAALNDSDLGELSIAIPEDLILVSSSDLNGSRAHRRANTSALSQQSAVGGVGDDIGQAVVDELFTAQFAPLVVRIEYTLEEPLGGLYFVQPDGAFAEREACVFTESHHRLARCWMPCFDTLMNHLTWQIELDVPADCMAVCVGDLRRHELSPDEQRKFFAYELSTPTLACDIGFAVGPFVPLVDPSRPSTVTHFCLPRHRALLREPARCVASTLDFLDEFLRTPLPYGNYKQVFVDEAYAEVSSHASLAICSAELLHDEAHVEVAMRARRLLTQAVVRQYFGCLLSPATWCDTWLLYGLATHVARLALVPTFGLNEMRFELAQLQRAAYPRDDDGSLGPAAPLYSAGRIDAVELLLDEVWCARATLVMHLIERNVGVDAMKKCLGALFLTPEGHVALQPPRRCWDTHGFMTHIKRLTGHDLRATASLYIFGRGDCPVTAGFAFNKRQRQFEFAFRLHFDGMLQEDTDALLENPQPLTVRVVETDGIYDHQVVLSDLDTVTSVPWYSRQRNTNRYRKRAVPMLQDTAQQQQQQQENGTTEMRKLRKTIAAFAQNVPAFPTFAHGGDAPSAPGSPGGGSPPGSPGGGAGGAGGGGDDDDEAGGAKAKKATARAKYAHDPTVDKYTGIPLTSASDVPVQWIHLDPLVQHLAPITQRQPLSMWLSMLQYSADVLSQSTAIRALDASESVPMQALVHMLCNPAVFWRVRVVAAAQLRNGAGTRAAGVDANWRPLEELLDFYKARHYVNRLRPLPLDFHDLAEYFVQKSVPLLVASVRAEDDTTPVDAINFILTLLKQYDNSKNDKNDAAFLASLIDATALLRAAPEPLANGGSVGKQRAEPQQTQGPLAQEVAQQVDRFLARERFLPSHLNLVGAAALRARAVLAQTRVVDAQDVRAQAEQCLAYGNHPHVRLAALDALLLLSQEGGVAQALATLDEVQSASVEPRFRYQVMRLLLRNDIGHPYAQRAAGAAPGDNARLQRRFRQLAARSATSQQTALQLWSWLNDFHTAYDPRLRAAVWQLYERAYGSGTPLALHAKCRDGPRAGAARLVGRCQASERQRRIASRPVAPKGGALMSTAATAMQITMPADIAHEQSALGAVAYSRSALARARKVTEKPTATGASRTTADGDDGIAAEDMAVDDGGGAAELSPPVVAAPPPSSGGGGGGLKLKLKLGGPAKPTE